MPFSAGRGLPPANLPVFLSALADFSTAIAVLRQSLRLRTTPDKSKNLQTDNIFAADTRRQGKEQRMTPKKVLVVDDEVHIVHVVAIKLRNNGYEPITAGNGEEAYELACKEKPDIIIADYMMPIMDGLELLEKLRANDQTREIPFILLTARNFAIDDARQQQLNVSQCITKPFSPKELLRTVEDIIYQGQLVDQS